jgi:SOS regulatory protein LexA
MEKKSSVWTTKPSKRQAEILKFITEFQKNKSYSPSLAEIAEHFGISTPTVHQHVSYLRKKKLLTMQRGKKRSIIPLNDQTSDLVEIPLMGIIAAGGPIGAIRNQEPIEVPRSMLSRGANHYALKVSGVSMIEEGISDGDVVIVRDQPVVENGEKAVAYLPDKDAVTLKKIYREKNRVKLVPANNTMKPFYERNVEVQGKVIGVLRKEV